MGERGRFGVVCSFGLSWCGRVVDLRCGKRNVTALAAAGLGVFPSGSPGKAQSVLLQQPASEVTTRTRTTAEDSLFARRAIPAACPSLCVRAPVQSIIKARAHLSVAATPTSALVVAPNARNTPSPPQALTTSLPSLSSLSSVAIVSVEPFTGRHHLHRGTLVCSLSRLSQSFAVLRYGVSQDNRSRTTTSSTPAAATTSQSPPPTPHET